MTKQTISVKSEELQCYGYVQKIRHWNGYYGVLHLDVNTGNDWEVTNLATQYRFRYIGPTLDEAKNRLKREAIRLIERPINPSLLTGHRRVNR